MNTETIPAGELVKQGCFTQMASGEAYTFLTTPCTVNAYSVVLISGSRNSSGVPELFMRFNLRMLMWQVPL